MNKIFFYCYLTFLWLERNKKPRTFTLIQYIFSGHVFFIFILSLSHSSILLQLASIILRGILVLLHSIYDLTFFMVRMMWLKVKTFCIFIAKTSWESRALQGAVPQSIHFKKLVGAERLELSDLRVTWPFECNVAFASKWLRRQFTHHTGTTWQEDVWNLAGDKLRVSVRNITQKRTKRTKITWDSAWVFFGPCIRVFHPARMLNLMGIW